MIGFFSQLATSILNAVGVTGTVEIAPIAAPDGKVTTAKQAKAMFSASATGKVYVKVKVGNSADTMNAALESLAFNGRRFTVSGFTRTDPKKGQVPVKRLSGGAPSDIEIGQAKAVVRKAKDSFPDAEQLLAESLKALVMEATEKREFTRKVLYVSAKDGKEVGIPPVTVQTKTYGKVGSTVEPTEATGNANLTLRVKHLGLKVISYQKDEKAESAPAQKVANG